MDISTIIGLVTILVAVVGSIMSAGDITTFVDVPSLLVVGLGCIGATFMKWPLDTVKNVTSIGMKAIFHSSPNPNEVIGKIEELANLARRESVFALENAEIDDSFMKQAAVLVADNRPAPAVEEALRLEIDSMKSRHQMGIDVFDGIGADGPAFGMIGTLIGLVIMLQNLSDPSAIGPAMAVALLTTFYGSFLANAFALPIKNKIAVRSEEEVLKMNIIIAGFLGILAGENPRLIKGKLNSFLPPSIRIEEEEAAGGEG